MKKTAHSNTITEEGMKARIKDVSYTLLPDGKTTVCCLVIENGYSVIGLSSCVDPKNYKQELGEKYSYEDAINQLWKLEGYLLADELHKGNKREIQTNLEKWEIDEIITCFDTRLKDIAEWSYDKYEDEDTDFYAEEENTIKRIWDKLLKAKEMKAK